jgi:HEAT repeat protein
MGDEKKKDHDLASRTAAADTLGRAAVSARVAEDSGLRETIGESLRDILTWDEDKADIRVQIASAISLCRLRDRKGVDFLLLQLARTDREHAGKGDGTEDVDVARQRELTALRVRAQEALTSSGDFVVSDLRKALDDPDAGDITRWAAITTLGELGVAEARPSLIEMLTATVPASQARPARGDPPAEIVFEGPDGPLRIDADRATVHTVALGGTDAPVPAHGKYVRQAAAQALGRIGGEAAAEALQVARTSHEALRGELQHCLDQREYAQLVPKEALDGDKKREAREALRDLCKKILEEQEDVLFYIGKAQATLRDERRELASQ